MTIIPPGDELVLQGPNGTAFRARVNTANGECDLVYTDPASGVNWVADTVIYQPAIVGMERARAMRLDWLSIDSENPFEAGGALDTTTLALSRRVVGRAPHKYDALWSMVFVGSATSAGALDQQYGAVAARIWDTALDVHGHAQGELRIAGNGFDHQGLLGVARGAVLTDADNQYPAGGDGGYLGFGTWNVPGGYYVSGNRVDRQTVNLGSAYVMQPNQAHWFGPGYDAAWATGAYWLTEHAGVLRNLVVRLPTPPVGTVTAVLQKQYADTDISVTLSGSAQQAYAAGGLQVGAGEAIGLKITMDGACVPQGGVKAAFAYGA